MRFTSSIDLHSGIVSDIDQIDHTEAVSGRYNIAKSKEVSIIDVYVNRFRNKHLFTMIAMSDIFTYIDPYYSEDNESILYILKQSIYPELTKMGVYVKSATYLKCTPNYTTRKESLFVRLWENHDMPYNGFYLELEYYDDIYNNKINGKPDPPKDTYKQDDMVLKKNRSCCCWL